MNRTEMIDRLIALASVLEDERRPAAADEARDAARLLYEDGVRLHSLNEAVLDLRHELGRAQHDLHRAENDLVQANRDLAYEQGLHLS